MKPERYDASIDSSETRMPVKPLATLALALALLFSSTKAQAEPSWVEQFVSAVGATAYAFAWPTATYEGATAQSVAPAPGGFDVTARLYGRSAFDNGSLWTDVVLEVRDWKVTDIRWGRHNALLVPPGATVQALGQALIEINRQYEQSRRQAPTPVATSQPVGEDIAVKNACPHPVRIAIRYGEPTGHWHSTGWWSFAPFERAYLMENGVKLKTMNATVYYFAQTTDGSGWEWAGGHGTLVGGEAVAMKSYVDDSGETEIVLTCTEPPVPEPGATSPKPRTAVVSRGPGEVVTSVEGRTLGMREVVDTSGDTEVTLRCNDA